MSILGKTVSVFLKFALVVLGIFCLSVTLCGLGILIVRGFDVNVFWMTVSNFLGFFGCGSLLREIHD